MAKRKKIKQYVPTDAQTNARVWCIKNNIKVIPEPRRNNKGIFLIVEFGALGEHKVSPDCYTNETLTGKIYEIYEYLYKKYF